MSEQVSFTISGVALTVAGVALAPAALAIASAVALARLSAHSRQLFADLAAAAPSKLETISPVEAAASHPVTNVSYAGLPRQEARLVAELASAAHLAVGDPKALETALRARPVEEWADIFRQEHQRCFDNSLLEAIGRACRRLNCTRVEVSGDQLVAEDTGGRAIAVQLGDSGKIKAEVLGVADGSCHRFLDSFIQALKAEGVEIGKLNDRRWTGGAPSTAAGLRWISGRQAQAKVSISNRTTGRRLNVNPATVRFRR